MTMRRALAAVAAVLSAMGAHAGQVRLDQMHLEFIQQGWGSAQADRSVVSNALSIGGTAFAHGVGTHAPSRAVVRLDGRPTRFQAQVGLNDTGRREPGTVEFTVLGDDQPLFRSGLMKGGDPARPVDLMITGVTAVTLQVTDGGDNIYSDHAVWADAAFTYEGPTPPALVDPSLDLVDERLYPALASRTASPGHTTYFIDPRRGDDAHPGTDRAAPWRSFAPLNRLRLAAGDRVEIQPGDFRHTLMPAGAGTATEPIEIHFAAGDFDFFPAQALKRKLHISNSNDDPGTPKPIACLFGDIQHLRVSGERSDLFIHGKMIELMCERAQDVEISGLAFDYRRPLVSEFTVLDVAEHHADVQIQKDATYAIESGQFLWIGEGWRSAGRALNQEYDPADDGRTWRCGSRPLGGVQRAEELAPNRVRFHFDRNTGFTKGRIFQCRETFRDMAGGFIVRSRNITVRDGAFHALGGMGIVHQFSENLRYERMQLAPRTGSGRTTCGWADMLHFSGCRGQITIDGVRFSGSHDDPVNVHGTHLRIVAQPAERQLRVRFMHPQTYGFPAFFAGDTVELIDHVSLCAVATAKVAQAEMSGEQEMLLTLDQPAPTWKPNDVLENVTWTPAVSIRNCRVEADSCRGFLLTTRQPVRVESNVFVKTTMSAIDIADDANSWFESGLVRDVVIRGNRFIQCGSPVVRIMPEIHQTDPAQPVHRNIRILDNAFELKGGHAIAARSSRGLVIRGNQPAGAALPVQLTACTDVELDW